MSALRRYCSLMGQGQQLGSEGDVVGCLRSLRAHAALDGVSWVLSGLVAIAVQNRRHHPFPPSGVAPARELVFGLLAGAALIRYAGLNSVPCRSMACMMMASRRASAIRAFRRVDRLAMANAQSFSFSGCL
jgi:hypothetical protein